MTIQKAIQCIITLSNMYEKLSDKEVSEYHKLKKYEKLGTVEECRKAINRQRKSCKPKYLGENTSIGCRVGECKCGNIIWSYQKFCDNCGVRLKW